MTIEELDKEIADLRDEHDYAMLIFQTHGLLVRPNGKTILEEIRNEIRVLEQQRAQLAALTKQ